ncbi:MAG: V-type ATP synthase subunit F [Streptosporangiaceae bacterium]|jgi:vacuolar-type H+-ATPase subunit F/Vma7
MSTVAVIGEDLRVQGFALAGAAVYPAGSEEEARRAWLSLPGDVAVVILTARAAGWLSDALPARGDVLPVVMPA